MTARDLSSRRPCVYSFVNYLGDRDKCDSTPPEFAFGFLFPSPFFFHAFLVGLVGFSQVIFHLHTGSFFPRLICMQGTQPRKPGVFKVSLQGNGVDLRFLTSDRTDHVGSSSGKSSSYSYSNSYQNPRARGHNIPKWPHFYDQIKVVCVTWN